MEKFAFIYFIWTIFLIGCLTAGESEETNGYIFTCPRSLKTGATNSMQFWRTGELKEGVITVRITYQDSSSSNESLAVEKEFHIEEDQSDATLDVYLEPMDNYAYDGKLNMSGTFGNYVIGGTDKVYFSSSRDNLTFIQTDKALYKEGQTVKCRVLRVDKNLRPVVEDKADIWVEDPSGTRLYQWKHVSLGKGIKQFEFLLADEPVEGEWKITVSFNGDISSTTFEVKKYVLPTFDVKIVQPPFVLANAEEIPIKVCANYTYGKPVKGKMLMNVSLETYAWSNDKLPTIEYEGKINGCFEYTINVSLVETEDYYRYRRLQIVASVEESATGVQRNETIYITRQYTPLNLNLPREKASFKPGIPNNGKLSVKNPDNTPAPDEDVQICCTINKERVVMDGMWKATRTVKYCKNYTSDENGEIEYVIPRQNTDSVSMSIEAKSLKYATEGKKSGSQRQNSLSQPVTSMSLTPWYSPSGSFIQLQQVQESILCGTKKSFKVLFTSKVDAYFTFYYQVINQGVVVYNGTIAKPFKVSDDVAEKHEDEDKVIDDVAVQLVPAKEDFILSESSSLDSTEECQSAKEARYVPPIGEVDLEIPIDSNLSPYFHLLVYYIRDDRETVADSLKFTVEKCFKNQVKLQFGDAIKQPGTKTSIRVTSSPNSLCGIKVVDKSVQLLNGNDQLTAEKIFRALESLDTGMYYGVNHCNEDVQQPGLYYSSSRIAYPPKPPRPWSSSSHEDTFTAFENCGFLTMSDWIMLTRPCKSRGGGGNIVYEDSSYGGYGGAVALASTARRPAPGRPQASPAMAPAAMDFSGDFETKSVVDVRDYFPETWLFDLEMTGEDGTYVTKEKLPHTITEWVGSAICINEEDGLGLSNTTTIKGFQAFFLSLTLPYSSITGETLKIPISIFSYANEPIPIKVTVDEAEGWELVGEPVDTIICCEPGASTNIDLLLKGTKVGNQNITVRAETAQGSDACGSTSESNILAKDAITKTLLVEPEGYPIEKAESILVCPKDEDDGTYTTTFLLKDPEDLVPDSQRAYFDVSGNVMGKSIDNLENLVNLPTGCGEQNMVKFAPNVVAMDVLTETKQLDEKRKTRIERNLNTGYQRQLQYKHSDNSFSAFGPRDKEGSMFLTAFVLKYFSRASRYIAIDNTTLVRMQQWIVSKQQADGCFENTGRIYDVGIKGSMEKDNFQGTMTAYVLSSLLISNYQNETVTNKALSCIKNSKDTSIYATFMYAYVEALAGKEELAKERFESVKGRAITKGKVQYYRDFNATKPQEVETNAYAVLARLALGKLACSDSGSTESSSTESASVESASDKADSVLPNIQFLTQNMNQRGGFYSTQDTCVGMEALGEFAKLTFKDPVDMTVKISGGLNEEIKVTEENKILVTRNKVDEVPSEVNVEATGSGCALIQVIVIQDIHMYSRIKLVEQTLRNFKLKHIAARSFMKYV